MIIRQRRQFPFRTSGEKKLPCSSIKCMNIKYIGDSMTTLPKIDNQHLIDFLVNLLNTASPTGFAEPAIAFVEKELSQFSQLQLSRTRKGALVAKWEVESDLPPVALTAHADTLGAVVKEIKPNGRLKLSRIG